MMEIRLGTKSTGYDSVQWFAQAVDDNEDTIYDTRAEDNNYSTPLEAVMKLALDIFQDLKDQELKINELLDK